MVKIHNLGFPRIGSKRELKFGLESYWQGKSTPEELQQLGKKLRKLHWDQQANIDLVPVGDFSFYDQVLDMSFLLGNIPQRFEHFKGDTLDNYFRVARGQSAHDAQSNVHAAEMTKWFDTNYHYIVPELTSETIFSIQKTGIFDHIQEAQQLGVNPKPIIIGPVTYLWLSKSKDNSNKLNLLPQLLNAYEELLNQFTLQGIEWVQMDEPILVTELTEEWQEAIVTSYKTLQTSKAKLLLTTYFGSLGQNVKLACNLPVAGLHVDAIQSREEVLQIISELSNDKVLSLGIINGRNIWKADLTETLNWLEPISQSLKDRLWIAPTCSLLHVPVDLNNEIELDREIYSWLSFAVQKLTELKIISQALNEGRDSVHNFLEDNRITIKSRKNSTRVHNPEVKAQLKQIDANLGKRKSSYIQRKKHQAAKLNLPLYPTTTIGSFPQTNEIRQVRNKFKQGLISEFEYTEKMQQEIAYCVQQQQTLGLDVFVHGEAERNDMVEYFGEHLEGYAFTQFGWVQSYGSRCVKPPILFGDITRKAAITVKWSQYAQSLTNKPMKAMLTGPVTILNWSFVRDDQPRSISCYQLALAMRGEVLDLERAGLSIIQIDEAALREGLPLRRSEWNEYLQWAVESFRITANGVTDKTQIHTHMCYSEFNDIIAAIGDMDADVITIETSRSDMELLNAFDNFKYPNEIGPGVYDIHSPNIPTKQHIINLLEKAAERIPAERLWVNPDCGLKTRQWQEVIPALQNMVAAAQTLRATCSVKEDAKVI